MSKVSPAVISNVAAGLANSASANAPSVLGLPAALASLRGPNGAYDPALVAAAAGIAQSQQQAAAAAMAAQANMPQLAGQSEYTKEINDVTLPFITLTSDPPPISLSLFTSFSERKMGASGLSSPAALTTPLASSQSNPFSLSRVASGNTPISIGRQGGRPATPTFELPAMNMGAQFGLGGSGPSTPGGIERPGSANRNRNNKSNNSNRNGIKSGSNLSNQNRKKTEELEEEIEDGEEEKDETLYCNCQRVSFGEVSTPFEAEILGMAGSFPFSLRINL